MAFGDLKVQDLIYEDGSNNEITVVLANLVVRDGSGNLVQADNKKFIAGTGSDLQIYHDGGSQSIIKDVTGDLKIVADNDDLKLLAEDDIVLRDNDDSTNFIHCINGGAVKLYYDGSQKFETTSAGTKAYGELQVTGDVHLNNGTNSGKDVKFVAASNLFRIYDGVKLTCGTGDDLQIYHNGSNSHIRNATGAFIIDNSGTGDLIIQAKQGENSIYALPDGAVNLYYDNSKKFETTSSGVTLSSSGSTNVLKIDGTGTKNLYSYADSSGVGWATGTGGSYGELVYLNDANSNVAIFAAGETTANFIGNGAVKLYYDGSTTPKLETTSTGIEVKDQIKVEGTETSQLNGNQLRFQRTSTSYIDQIGGGSLAFRTMDSGSETTRMTVQSGGNVNLPDNGHLTFGASNDLQIFQTGSHSYVDNYTGVLHIRARGSASGISLQPKSGEYGIEIDGDGAVELYYDGGTTPKFETTSTGTKINGNIQIQCDTSAHKGLEWYSHTDSLGCSFTYGQGNANPTLNIYRQDAQSGFPYGNLIINTGHPSSPTQALKLRTDKNIELAGNLIMASGKGIDFSATSDATGKTSELLDDYEEGVHLATIVASTSGSWNTTSYRYLQYIKIGRLVHIQGYLNINSESSPIGNVMISLPFTVASDGTEASENGSLSVSLRGHNGSTSLYNVEGAVQPGTTYFEIVAVAGTGGHTWLSDSQLDGSWNIRIGGTYVAA